MSESSSCGSDTSDRLMLTPQSITRQVNKFVKIIFSGVEGLPKLKLSDGSNKMNSILSNEMKTYTWLSKTFPYIIPVSFY